MPNSAEYGRIFLKFGTNSIIITLDYTYNMRYTFVILIKVGNYELYRT